MTNPTKFSWIGMSGGVVKGGKPRTQMSTHMGPKHVLIPALVFSKWEIHHDISNGNIRFINLHMHWMVCVADHEGKRFAFPQTVRQLQTSMGVFENLTVLAGQKMVSLGHGFLKGLLHKMEIYKNKSFCRLCNEEEETASHIFFECTALCQRIE